MKVHSPQEIDACVDAEGDGSGDLPELLIWLWVQAFNLTLPCCYVMSWSMSHPPQVA
jgi:hypothetical protein